MINMTKQQIGELVKHERILRNLTQKELAAKAGLSRYQAILEIENASKNYQIENLLCVLSVLKVQVLPEYIEEDKPITGIIDFGKVKSAKLK